MTLGSKIYAVGGSRSIGSERSIEMWDGGSLGEWTEVGQTNGYRWVIVPIILVEFCFQIIDCHVKKW